MPRPACRLCVPAVRDQDPIHLGQHLIGGAVEDVLGGDSSLSRRDRQPATAGPWRCSNSRSERGGVEQTVTQATEPGYITVYPDGASQPLVSNLNISLA
jgi:hypothetical protein